MIAQLELFPADRSPYFQSLAKRTDVRALIDLPVYGGGTKDTRATYFQTIHGKKIPQGRITGFAATQNVVERARVWNRTYSDLTRGEARGILFLAQARCIDRLVLHKKISVYRKSTDLGGQWCGGPSSLPIAASCS